MKGKTSKQLILLIIGSISLFLGSIGLVLPILPTTPFLLLSAYCYLNSSKRLYRWLMSHPIFGLHLYHYMKYHAVRKSAKVGALLFLWLSLGTSIYFIQSLWLQIILAVIGVLVSIHILSLKTLPKGLQQQDTRPETEQESI